MKWVEKSFYKSCNYFPKLSICDIECDLEFDLDELQGHVKIKIFNGTIYREKMNLKNLQEQRMFSFLSNPPNSPFNLVIINTVR